MPRLQFRIKVTAEPWSNRIDIEAAKKLKKLKRAHANVQVKLFPVDTRVFDGLHDLVSNLQPMDGGRHVTALKQIAGTSGGEKKEYAFDIISGALTAAFFKSTFVEPHNQGSLLLREDGNIVAIIPPISFGLRFSLPMHLAELNMTVSFDVAALPRDGVFRFDETSVVFFDEPKRQMKYYICGELKREMLDAYHAMDPPTA